MACTRTLLVDIGKPDRQGTEGTIVLRLMMACNDLTTANQALGACRQGTSEKNQHIRRGSLMYFVRLQMGHLHESLKIVGEIPKCPTLLRLIEECPGRTADDFAHLLCFTEGGPQRNDFLKYVELVRHKVAFHYDSGKIKTALTDRARRKGDLAHRVTVADDIRQLRFQVADDLVDTLICHHVWGIAHEGDTRIEADRIAEFGFGICKIFLDFAGNFIVRYIERCATFTR